VPGFPIRITQTLHSPRERLRPIAGPGR
jgi:hypothetical protein